MKKIELLSIIVNRPHVAHGRDVPSGSLFHASVQIRKKKLDYKPNACCPKDTESYVC
jgi:hypothetical protein